jgi:hypothetical protein
LCPGRVGSGREREYFRIRERRGEIEAMEEAQGKSSGDGSGRSRGRHNGRRVGFRDTESSNIESTFAYLSNSSVSLVGLGRKNEDVNGKGRRFSRKSRDRGVE